jgi:hypothetical protein
MPASKALSRFTSTLSRVIPWLLWTLMAHPKSKGICTHIHTHDITDMSSNSRQVLTAKAKVVLDLSQHNNCQLDIG